MLFRSETQITSMKVTITSKNFAVMLSKEGHHIYTTSKAADDPAVAECTSHCRKKQAYIQTAGSIVLVLRTMRLYARP